MEYFKQQVLLLREKALLQASVREEKKLLVENAKLKKDIDDLKKLLQDTQRRKAGGRREPGTVARPDLGASALETDSGVDVSRLDLRVGRILSVRCHLDAESLCVQEVDLGETTSRMVVSGLVKHLTPEQMHDRLTVLLCNVRPVKVRGVLSQARILCAFSQDDLEPLEPPTGAQPGDRVTFQGYPGDPDRELNPKRRVWERLQSDLRTDTKGVATYRGVAFEVRGKGLCRAPSISHGGIK
ncbi:aminoacyl tRNA synthase complex-interacting multifunctional protein 1 [Chanos chanos]|uniref:Aminoacyl tRNA synthase complex-interacting multifunctional protein 1 n=1 Tax=Chanos chanos TaxID=29144 RepID=A0A6J2VD86_CHACN|nr:aminoacyl tRNA synthase complex-interacting multifunctional protein 1-like [Chanos chanos]